MKQALILVADDNQDIRSFLSTVLKQDGHSVIEAATGADALEKFSQYKPDLVILDIAMGLPDGIEVGRQIRAKSSIPMIILTVKDGDLDEVMALAIGADDFITKPSTPQVISLRVAIQLRHAARRQGSNEEVLRTGNLRLNLMSRELLADNNPIALTRTEFNFLRLLMSAPDRVFTRDEVYDSIEGSSEFSSNKLLDTHASRIRLKIKAAGGNAKISAVRGVGFKISANKPA